MVDRILEITFVLIIIFLVLSNASGFSDVSNAISNSYVKSVRVLQGR